MDWDEKIIHALDDVCEEEHEGGTHRLFNSLSIEWWNNDLTPLCPIVGCGQGYAVDQNEREVMTRSPNEIA